MDERELLGYIERAFAIGIKVGVINLATELGLINENISEKQAFAKYGKRLVKEWRSKRWIVGYPTGNTKRSKVFYKRSELETASRMLDMHNIIPPTRIRQLMNQ